MAEYVQFGPARKGAGTNLCKPHVANAIISEVDGGINGGSFFTLRSVLAVLNTIVAEKSCNVAVLLETSAVVLPWLLRNATYVSFSLDHGHLPCWNSLQLAVNRAPPCVATRNRHRFHA